MGCRGGAYTFTVACSLQDGARKRVGRFLEDEAVRLNLSISIIAVIIDFKNVFGLELG